MKDDNNIVDLPLSRQHAIASMREMIRQLEARVAALEAGLAELTALTVGKKK